MKAIVELPRSKSVAARAAVIASMALPPGPRLHDKPASLDLQCYPDAEDSIRILQLLKERPPVMDCGMGGTTFRFLMAWCAVQEGEEHVITGDPRLLERPHDALAAALRTLGADIDKVPEGYRVRGRAMRGGRVDMDSPLSSQFISALMMIAPRMEEGMELHWTGRKRSEPYVSMTAVVMAWFKADFTVTYLPKTRIEIDPGGYVAQPFTVPVDWSAAAFFYQLAALWPGAAIEFPDLIFDDFQGDQKIAQLMADDVRTGPYSGTRFGQKITGMRIAHRALRRVPKGMPHFNLVECPDLFPSLALAMAALGREARFSGLHTLPFKESDRMAAVTDVLAALGVAFSREEEALIVRSSPAAISALADRDLVFDPRNDHRMAMALAPLCAVCRSITIRDHAVVAKSFPDFWRELMGAGVVGDRNAE